MTGNGTAGAETLYGCDLCGYCGPTERHRSTDGGDLCPELAVAGCVPVLVVGAPGPFERRAAEMLARMRKGR